MSTFTLHLQDATRYERVEGVTSFVGEDRTGGFGILAGHARMMTSLVFGLARFRLAGDEWQYLALPGGLLYFVQGALFVSTRRYLRDTDYTRISLMLERQLRAEEEQQRTVKESLQRLEQEMLRRLGKSDAWAESLP